MGAAGWRHGIAETVILGSLILITLPRKYWLVHILSLKLKKRENDGHLKEGEQIGEE